MPHAEQHYQWRWELAAPPEALWPLVSNTDRFNRDCGYPAVAVVSTNVTQAGTPAAPPTRRLRARIIGIPIEWDERAFEWIAPRRFAVERRFHSGPVAALRLLCELTPRDAGTTLIYTLRITPATALGALLLPFAIGRKARAATERVFRRYDELAQRGARTSQLARKPKLAPGGAERLAAIVRTLLADAAQPTALVAKLQEFIATADDLSVARIRPYALADEWRASRRDTLHLCLHATRAGLLDFSWDLVCPHCRGAKASHATLAAVHAQARCDACDVDFTVNFDQSVELTFSPNAAVRPVVRVDYCVGGPQNTPHIVAQQPVAAGAARVLRVTATPGRYRVRTSGLAEHCAFRVVTGGAPAARLEFRLEPEGVRLRFREVGTAPEHVLPEPMLAEQSDLTLVNATTAMRHILLEHLAWTDQATTAAEVTSLQLFRDLFSREVLRPREHISVGAMTVVFTDLKNSTQLYQRVGDAPAFGRVLTHFEILKRAVAEEDGCIVKTMGDAILAVFPRPVAAVRAIAHAQRWLAFPQEFALPADVAVPPSSLQPLALKAGIHAGPCLAINQNERLDYFGTTVNITARLCSLCTGEDLILSDAVRSDPEVSTWLERSEAPLRTRAESVTLKGFGQTAFTVWRIAPAVVPSEPVQVLSPPPTARPTGAAI